MSNKTLIIAEAGVNHNGKLSIAKDLIDIAASCGADYIKFQTFKADDLLTKNAKKASYQKKTTSNQETQYQLLKRLELSEEMHIDLISHCKKRKINFLSTGFDIDSIKMLMKFGQDFIKVPSGEINNLPYLKFIGSLKKPVILSSGMSHMQEIEDALEILEKAGCNKNKIIVLHCNTEYPTPKRDVNLKAMLSIKEKFGVKVGYSDHTSGIEIPIAAVALGATIIEKHFTIDRTFEGPDHKASLEPHELLEMIKSIRNIENALGDGVKKPSSSENKNIAIVRKSIVASKNIKKGEFFTNENLTTKRPGTGISPMMWDKLIGKKSKKNFKKDQQIKL